ncbi:MAG: acyl-CoA dehydrogenase family protein [Chloroflexota bacterium]
MDFRLTEQHLMLQKVTRDFVTKECLSVERELQEKDPDWVELPRDMFLDLRKKVQQIGLWAIDVPEEFGGAGLDNLSYCLIREEQSKTTIGTAHFSPFWGPSGNHIFPVLYRASDYIKERYLHPLIRGEKRSGLCQTEADAGSDASAIKTTATRKDGQWTINGAKRFSTLGDRSDFMFVTAITEPVADRKQRMDSMRIFAVDKDTPGLKINRILRVIRPQYSTEIVLDDCKVSEEHCLPENGYKILAEHLSKLRLLIAPSCLGRAQRSVDMVLSYVPDRHTFGQPLSSRQAIQWMMVDCAMDIHLTRLFMLETAWKLDQGMDASQEASMLKVFSTESAFRCVDLCMQCLGGIGLTKDLPLERWLRELRVMRITEGPTEVHKWTIARNILRGWRP